MFKGKEELGEARGGAKVQKWKGATLIRGLVGQSMVG
jgi:hypothetical protein